MRNISAVSCCPAMPNVHSHAFQRAMAGLAERQTDAEDSFWTWRETMYAFAGRVDPDSLRAIAAQLYVEMLKAGYTHVCEFHYLHHQPDGQPYADAAAMSLALIEAAQETGIGLTLLPTLYITGGFDGRALSERQRRFGHSVDSYLALLEKLRKVENAALRIGIALHSLRAVPEEAMRRVLADHPLRQAADPHPCRRADRRSAGLPRGAQCAAGRMAARSRAGGRALVPRARHARERRGTARHRADRRGRRTVSDHRSQSRRRRVSAEAIPQPRRRDRASDRTATFPFRRSRNCAGSNTASA